MPLVDVCVCLACGFRNGPRMRFCGQCGTPLVPLASLLLPGDFPQGVPPSPDRERVFGPVAPPGWLEAAPLVPTMDERKRVTILFGDISGFVQLAEQLDPEEVKQLMDRCLRRLAEAVEAYEGRVDKFLGDNIMALFGAPRAHEDDAERAVRCALAMQAAISDLSTLFEQDRGIRLSLHIGINTGEVLAGRVGSGRHQDYTVMGDAVNLAARLQHAAQAGQILVGEATHRATSAVIDYSARGTIQVRGKSEPVNTWEAAGVKTRRGSQRGLPGLTARMVGRDAEFAQLTGRFQQVAAQQELHQVLLLGAAGVGKSRLLEEFETYLDGLSPPIAFRKGRCLPYGLGVRFGALAEIIKRQCGILDDDPRPAAEAKLGAAVQALFAEGIPSSPVPDRGTDRDAPGPARSDPHRPLSTDTLVQWLGIVVGLRRAEDGPARDPETVKEQLFWALRRFLARLAERGPLVLAFEDIHWADSYLLDFLEHIREHLAHLPILILCLARPELAENGPGAAWVERSGQLPTGTLIDLAPLTAPESRTLIRELLPGARLPLGFPDLVLSKAEGNPFYIEEIMRMLIDAETLVCRAGGWEVVKPLEGLWIPDTVQALVGARLDSLPELEKRVIQAASVVGRIFWQQAVGGLFPPTLQAQVDSALAMLESREFIVPSGHPTLAGEAEYSFRNILTRDVAYHSLPKALRGMAHAHVGAWIEATAGERVGEFADQLADHYEQALGLSREMQTLEPVALVRLETKAIQFLEQAGAGAAARQALVEAEQYYGRALALIERGAGVGVEGAPRVPHPRYLSVLCSHAEVVAAQEDYPRALAELDTVIAQTRWVDRAQWAQALLKRADTYRQQGNLAAVGADAGAALEAFQEWGERAGQAQAHLQLGTMHRHRDNMEAARQALQQALDLFRQGAAPGEPLSASDLRGEARALRELGSTALSCDDLVAAERYLVAALDRFRRLDDQREAVNCLRSLALRHWYEADLRQFDEYMSEALALTRELGYKHGEALVLVYLGLVNADRRRLDRAERYSQRALDLLQRLGDRRSAVWALRTLGITAGLRGETAQALAHYTQALELAQAGGIHGVLPELHRGLAEVFLAQGAVTQALEEAETSTQLTAPDDHYSQVTTWRVLGLAQLAAGQVVAARHSLEQSVGSTSASTYLLEYTRSCAALALTAARQGDTVTAAQYRTRTADLLDRLVWTDGLPPTHKALLMLACGPAGRVP